MKQLYYAIQTILHGRGRIYTSSFFHFYWHILSQSRRYRSKNGIIIAIRKVNGAEASTILRLLSRDILYVAVPSVLIGIVVSYFTGKAWLDQFAETIDMNALYFVGTALVIIALIVVCVVVRAWRIANENPVKSIKVE